MTLDLGPYALEVLSAYGGAIVLLVGLIAVSVLKARKVAQHLHRMESRRIGAAE